MAQDDIYRAAFRYTAPGANPNGMVYVIHYQIESIITPVSDAEEASELAGELINRTQSLYLSHLPDAITFEDVEVIGVSNPLVGIKVSSGQNGLVPNQPVPYRNAVHTTNKTGLRGRSYNGRTNLMACSEGVQNGGVIDNSHLTGVFDYMNDIATPVGSVTSNAYRMGVYSKEKLVFTPVTNFIVQSNFATVRNRQVSG